MTSAPPNRPSDVEQLVDTAQPPDRPLGKVAIEGVFWSLVQNWSARIITFGIFVLLAKFLTPAQYGIASAAQTCLLLVAVIAEFGFGDAIIQRRNLQPADVNLPFFTAVGSSTLLALALAFSAGPIERWLGVNDVAPVVVALAGIAPLTTIAQFQEFSYRKALAFRLLATRVLVANLVAGAVAIACAYAGFGVWSIVVQAYLTVGVGLFWLWRRPRWIPSFEWRPRQFRELARFGAPVVGMRVIDFATMRLVDVIIVWRFGIAVLGLYAVGSRLYQTLLQLLQSALNDVSLTVLSRVAHDREKIGAIYLRSITLSGFIGTPVFVLVAALSPEVCTVLFGERWAGVDRIAMPLLLVGALQCIQFLNGPYLSARGRPGLVFVIGSVKYAGMIAGLLLLPSSDPVTTVGLFAALQLTATPLNFFLVSRELAVPSRAIVGAILPSALACAAGFSAVGAARPLVHGAIGAPLVDGVVLGAVYAAGFLTVGLVFGRRQLMTIIAFVRERVLPRRGSGAA